MSKIEAQWSDAARGTFPPTGGGPNPVANNFMVTFKRGADGCWQA